MAVLIDNETTCNSRGIDRMRKVLKMGENR